MSEDSDASALATGGAVPSIKPEANLRVQRVRRAASFLYFVFAAGVILTGGVYAASPQFMPYHAEVAGMAWSEIPERLRMLHLAFQHGAGMLAVAFGGVLVAINAYGFRRGERWAAIALPASGLAVGLPILDIALQLTSATGAQTPIIPLILGAILLGTAVFLQWVEHRLGED